MNQLPPIEKDSMIHDIILWVLEEDKSYEVVVKRIKAYLPEATDNDVEELIKEAFERIYDIHHQQNSPQEIIKQHIEIYEKIYAYFKSINHAAGCNKALQAKERLLEILKTSNKVVLQKIEKRIIHAQHSSNEYDLNKLTPAEQSRMQELLGKMSIK